MPFKKKGVEKPHLHARIYLKAGCGKQMGGKINRSREDVHAEEPKKASGRLLSRL